MNPATPPEPSSPIGRSIMEQLNAIDLSRLDKLLTLRQEQERLHTFRSKALEKQDQVSPAVRARVLADYERRFAALDEQSAPLRAAARTEYRKLQTLVQDVERARSQALEKRQEAEFRHEVGELTAEELAERLVAPNAELERCERESAALQSTAERFVSALGADIEGAAGQETETPAAPLPASLEQVPRTVVSEAPPPEQPAPVPAVPEAGAAATSVGGIPIFDGGDDAFAELTSGPADDPAEATFAFTREQVEEHFRTQSGEGIPAARSSAVLILDDEGDVQEYAVGGVSAIGRADQNQIQIVKPGISRRHAVVEETADGYLLRDLQSNNGTYVNGERINEHLLADGDVVEVGPVKLIFRA